MIFENIKIEKYYIAIFTEALNDIRGINKVH